MSSDSTPIVADSVRGAALARNAFHLLLGQAASTTLSMTFSAVLGRKLGAADFGVYFLVMSMSTFAYVFVDWGQSAYLIREAARRPAEAGSLLGSALAFRALSAAAAIAFTVGAAHLLGYDGRVQLLAGLAVLCALPLALSQPFGYLFRGRDRMDLDALVSVSGKAFTVGMAIPALLLGGHLPAVITAQGLAGVGALAIAVLLARRMRIPAPRPSRETVHELATRGASIAVFFLAVSVQPYLDAIVLSRLAPASAVGWYGAARNIMGVLLAPATILATASFPHLSRVAMQPQALRVEVRRSLRPIMALGALGAMGTFLFADLAVTLIYGKGRFDPASRILQLFAPVLLLFFVGILLATVITAVGRTRELAAAKLVSVVLSTGLGIVLIPWFQARFGNGGLGLVAAFGSTEVLMLIASLKLAPPGSIEPGTLLDLARAAFSAVGTLAVFHWSPPVSPWLKLPASIVLFTAFTLATGLVRWGELSGPVARALRR